MSRNNIVLRLGLVSRKRHHHIALFSTSTARPAKARPVSKVTLAQVALRRMFARQGSKPEFPKAVSILHGVHGHVNGRAVFASAASESITNVISETLARECSLHVSPAVSGEWLLLPDGREIKPVGIATGKWSFRGETSIQATVDFAVLKSPSRPLILGSDLLRSSRTTDINWHRLRTRTTEPEDFSCVHIVGEPPSSIAGKLEGNPIYALAATGCEVSLVSLDFVTKNYLKFKWKSPKEPHSLKFIDGGCIPIDKTIVLHWQYGDEWTEWPAEFVVVPGLPWDVVLGQQFLYGSGAFFRYVNCFRKARPTSRQAGISAMPSLLMLSFAAKPDLRGDTEDDILEEAIRREANSRDIELLPTSQREAALKQEDERREAWNNGHRDGDSPDHSDALVPDHPASSLDTARGDSHTFSMATITTTETASISGDSSFDSSDGDGDVDTD